MVGSDENDAGVVRASDLPRGPRAIGGKISIEMVENGRALNAIDENIVRAEPHPLAVHKRSAITDENANVANKNRKIHVDHPFPTTRKYAAEIASMQQPISEETMLLVPLAYQRDGFKDSMVVDVDDYKASRNKSPSMHLQQTKAKLDDIQMADGIGIEFAEYCPVVNIDSADKKNVLAVVEYVDDIHAFYKKTESPSHVPPNYMDLQPAINKSMRAILIDWLIQVHQKFELMDETLYLTVNLVDRFLAVQPLLGEKLQLVGVTAMLLASKYEEVYVPVVEDFVLITDNAYSREEVLCMEIFMAKTLQLNFSLPTPYAFTMRFLKAAQSDKELEHLTFFLLELCLVEYQMLRFLPSKLAAAAVFTAQCTLTGRKEWSKTCEKYTNYTEDQLLKCSKLMVTLHENAGIGELTGVYRKYNTYKFGYAARYEPAFFLSDA